MESPKNHLTTILLLTCATLILAHETDDRYPSFITLTNDREEKSAGELLTGEDTPVDDYSLVNDTNVNSIRGSAVDPDSEFVPTAKGTKSLKNDTAVNFKTPLPNFDSDSEVILTPEPLSLSDDIDVNEKVFTKNPDAEFIKV